MSILAVVDAGFLIEKGAVIEHIRWLHVSDLHLRADSADFSQKVAVEALRRDVEARHDPLRPPSFVLVTGDVAFSGRADEYLVAEAVFSDLRDATGVEQSRFYFVPGNHDVDRTRSRLHHAGACGELTSEMDVDRVLGTPDDVGPLLDRQHAFWEFVDRFTTGQERVPIPCGLGFFAPLDIGGHKMGIVGMNSAWLSGKDGEEMRLLIGERQIIEALDISRDANPYVLIAMAHHPIDWLFEWDQVPCRRRLLAAADLFHRGHLHDPDVTLSSSPKAPCLAIAAGSGHSTRFYRNSYNIIDLDMGTGTCTVQAFSYDPSLSRYEPGPTDSATLTFRAALPGTQDDLSAAIAAAVPESAKYADYLAALIAREKEEVPVRISGTVDFLVPSAGRALVGDDVRPAEDFLRLRNLLRLHDDSVSMEQRVRIHRETVARFVEYLDGASGMSSGALTRLTRRTGEPVLTTRATELPYTTGLLRALIEQGEWDLIERQAPTWAASKDPELTRLAKFGLGHALMRSDDSAKRGEGARLGAELLRESDASADEYLLAGGSAEVVGDDETAARITTQAVNKWPTHIELLTYARGLATRTGNSELRAAIDRSREAKNEL